MKKYPALLCALSLCCSCASNPSLEERFLSFAKDTMVPREGIPAASYRVVSVRIDTVRGQDIDRMRLTDYRMTLEDAEKRRTSYLRNNDTASATWQGTLQQIRAARVGLDSLAHYPAAPDSIAFIRASIEYRAKDDAGKILWGFINLKFTPATGQISDKDLRGR